MIFRDASATIGNTPLVDLGRLAKNLPGRVVAKLEMRNPCGSVKDRLGAALIEDAERRGLLPVSYTHLMRARKALATASDLECTCSFS